MPGRKIIIKFFVFCLLLESFGAGHLFSQDWVHPYNRQYYKGYEKFKEQKKNSSIWKYATNRDLGNTRGGGTTEYWDYKPSYRPKVKYKKKYNRPKRVLNNSNSCNCKN